MILPAQNHSELEACECLHKKYCRSVNILYGLCTALGVGCVVVGVIRVGAVVGIMLEGITRANGLLEIVWGRCVSLLLCQRGEA